MLQNSLWKTRNPCESHTWNNQDALLACLRAKGRRDAPRGVEWRRQSAVGCKQKAADYSLERSRLPWQRRCCSDTLSELTSPVLISARFRFMYSENVNSWDIHIENVIDNLLPNTQTNLYFITGNRFVADRFDMLN